MTLAEKILLHGIENCIFLIPMRPTRTYFGLISIVDSSDKEFIVPAKIDEGRYKIKDNYKITLRCIYDGFSAQHFYISDLESFIKSGQINFYIKS